MCENRSTSNEKSTLLDSRENQRQHVIGILDGLTSEQLHQPVLPSGWSSLGLVQHLAVDVEQFWFLRVVAGETVESSSKGDRSSAWQVTPDTSPEVVFDIYRAEIERANSIISGTALDAAPAAWPDFFGEWRLDNLRAVMLHVIAETACHAGHLDAVRELIDGRTWLTLN